MNCTLALAVMGLCQLPVVDGICPPDRPHSRTMTFYPMSQTCTLLACTPKVECGKEQCVSIPTRDCNHCLPEPEVKAVCLSDEELKNAR